MTPVFETERLVVRAWRDDEAPRLFDIRRRPEITRWFGTPVPMASEAEAVERIARWRAMSEADPRLGSWAICERSGGPPAGSILLKTVEGRPEEIEVGWDLHPDATGRGLATEAARGAIAKAYADGAPEVFALTHVDNFSSRRVAVRAGMRDLGVVVDYAYPGESQLFRARPLLAHDDAGDGPAVVLIHGHPFDRTMWTGTVDALRGEFRVIAPDLRGYGASPAVPRVTMRDLADDVEALLDALGVERAAVVGLSMGGLVAMELATANPARWRKLGLVATTAEPVDDDERDARHAMADRIAAEGMEPQVDAMLPKLFGPGAPPAARERIAATMRATDPAGAAAALRGRAARPDYRPGLRALRMPVFVCTGTEDPYSTTAVTQTILGRRAARDAPLAARRRPPAEPRGARRLRRRARGLPALRLDRQRAVEGAREQLDLAARGPARHADVAVARRGPGARRRPPRSRARARTTWSRERSRSSARRSSVDMRTTRSSSPSAASGENGPSDGVPLRWKRTAWPISATSRCSKPGRPAFSTR